MYTAKIIIIAFSLMMICFGVVIWANTSVMNLSQKAKAQKINSYRDCARAGYPVQESYPRKCVIPQGKTFIEQLDTPEPSLSDFSPGSGGGFSPSPKVMLNNSGSTCINKCGDQVCQIVVCLGTNCPCAETVTSCPQDCQ